MLQGLEEQACLLLWVKHHLSLLISLLVSNLQLGEALSLLLGTGSCAGCDHAFGPALNGHFAKIARSSKGWS